MADNLFKLPEKLRRRAGSEARRQEVPLIRLGAAIGLVVAGAAVAALAFTAISPNACSLVGRPMPRLTSSCAKAGFSVNEQLPAA